MGSRLLGGNSSGDMGRAELAAAPIFTSPSFPSCSGRFAQPFRGPASVHELRQRGAEVDFDDLVVERRAEVAQERVLYAYPFVEVLAKDDMRVPLPFDERSQRFREIGPIPVRDARARKERGQQVADALS